MIKHLIILLWAVAFIPLTCHSQNRQELTRQDLPETWISDSLFRPSLSDDTTWWKSFGDPLLDSLINVSLKNNYSLSSSLEKVKQAKATFKQALSDFYPSLALATEWQRQQNSLNSAGTPEPESYRFNEYQNFRLTSQLEIDVFGSIRKNAKALNLQYLATESEYYAAILSLCSNVASTYFNLRCYQQQYVVAQENIVSQKKILDLTLARYNAGLASQLDVSQAKSVYYSTQASLPSLQSSIESQINSLAILVGVFPSQIRGRLQVLQDLPEAIRIINVGIPANVIRRRPDIMASERAIEAAAASLGATRADYYPKFYLEGSFGYLAHDWDKMFDRSSQMFEINPSLTWNLFSGFEVRHATAIAKAQLQESIDAYNQNVMTAIQQVESAMSAYSNALKSIVAMQQVVAQGKKTLQLSIDLYKRGLGSFQSVLDSQQSLLSYQNNLVSSQNSALIALVQLYIALGGGYK
jgi:efflux transporter, outer membrane factor (OMF) lipoprotein, NodT family